MKKTILLLLMLFAFTLAACSTRSPAPAANGDPETALDSSEPQAPVKQAAAGAENASDEEQATDAPQETPEKAPEEPQEEAPEEAPEEPQEEEADILQIGSTATLGDWEITVTDFAFTTSISNGYGAFTPDDGNQFGVVHATVTNLGKDAATFLNSFGFGNDNLGTKILYGDGYEFSSSSLLAYDDDLHNAFLNPLSSKSGVAAFQIPESVVTSTEPLTVKFFTPSDEVIFSLR